MAKRKPAGAIPDQETIHYRPSAQLGRLLSELAGKWDVSRGEAARRLALFAAYGLDVDFHDLVQAAEGPSLDAFEEGCRRIQTHIATVCAERGTIEQDLPKAERLTLARELVDSYRYLQLIDEKAEEKRLEIRIVRFE